MEYKSDQVNKEYENNFTKDNIYYVKYIFIGKQARYVFFSENILNLNYFKNILYYEKLSQIQSASNTQNKITCKNMKFDFIKKDKLDTLIIRRFKKYLKLKLTNNLSENSLLGLGLEDNKTNEINNSLSLVHVSSKDSTSSKYSKFAFDFAINVYTPPFKIKNLAFKSFNISYSLPSFAISPFNTSKNHEKLLNF